jgi:hypothetical protein
VDRAVAGRELQVAAARESAELGRAWMAAVRAGDYERSAELLRRSVAVALSTVPPDDPCLRVVLRAHGIEDG